MKTLYKKNVNGKILQWDMVIEGNRYWAEYGQVGGKIQADTPTVCEGKNIGRANETTPEEQALSEARAKHKKQIDMRGYVEDIGDVDKTSFSPMLAHPFDKYGHKLPDKVEVSAKLDGLRCYITKEGAFSRNGKQWVSTKFIEESLKPFFEAYPDIVLDGEIYNHRYKDNFNKIVSLAKKTKNISDADWVEIEESLEYHIFDCYHEDEPDMKFTYRYEFLYDQFGGCGYKNIFVVESTPATKTDFYDNFAEFIEQGYEGIMLRDPDSPYEFKRSKYLIKYKEFQDGEHTILDIIEGVGNRSGMFGKMILDSENGSFEANSRGDEMYYKELLYNKEKYIGKLATIRYQNLTPDGIPRFPVCICIRDYE